LTVNRLPIETEQKVFNTKDTQPKNDNGNLGPMHSFNDENYVPKLGFGYEKTQAESAWVPR